MCASLILPILKQTLGIIHSQPFAIIDIPSFAIHGFQLTSTVIEV